MKRLWVRFRCRWLHHDWIQQRLDEETFFECRRCGKRYFGDKLPNWEDDMKDVPTSPV